MSANRPDQSEPPRLVCIGAIVGVHGVRGLVKLQSFTDPPSALAHYKGITDQNGKPVGVTIQSANKGQFLARVEGVADRDAAGRLRGIRLFVARDDMPQPDEDEFYHADLIGMQIVDEEGSLLGHIKAVPNYGASDILEITGAGRPDFMVPLAPQFVLDIDLETGRVMLAPFVEVE